MLSKEDNELEKKVIKEAIMKYYHEGHAQSDPELYKEILHEDWRFFWFQEGKFSIADRETYMSWYDPKNLVKSLQWETEFFYIDITENIGAVKIRLENQKVCYIDYFNLMKIDGKWWIVHKISHGIKKGQ